MNLRAGQRTDTVHLRTRTCGHDGFSLRQVVNDIPGQTPRVSDAWEVRTGAIREAIADCHVALAVHGNTAHPAIQRGVGCVDLLLHRGKCNGTTGDIQLGPLRAYGRRRTSSGRVHYPQRFCGTHLAVLHFLHQPITQGIDFVGRVRLRYAVLGRCRVAGLTDVGYRTQSAARSAVCTRREFAHLKAECGLRLGNKIVGRAGRR